MTDQPPQRGWTVWSEPQAVETMLEMAKAGDAEAALYASVLRYLRALALEAGAAIEAGKKPPGLPMTDGRISLDVPREPVMVFYTVDQEHRELRVTELIWVQTL